MHFAIISLFLSIFIVKLIPSWGQAVQTRPCGSIRCRRGYHCDRSHGVAMCLPDCETEVFCFRDPCDELGRAACPAAAHCRKDCECGALFFDADGRPLRPGSKGCKVNVCKLPKDPGPCRASIRRWYFNGALGRCEEFVYGGCGGNGNNFATLSECQRGCRESRRTCSLKPDTGPCKALFQRYYYKPSDGQCHLFIYGGCPGNANNFETIAECMRHCGRRCRRENCT